MKKFKYLLLVLFSLLPILKVNAASGVVDIYSSNKYPTVGSSFTVTVYCKISGASIGGCEYNLSYPSNVIMTSGETYNVEPYKNYGDKTITKTFTFKAVSTGSATITATGCDIQDVDTNHVSTSVSPVTVNISTPGSGSSSSSSGPASTNNNLSSLKIAGIKLTPDFNKDKLEYTGEATADKDKIKIEATAEDSTATIEGAGEKVLTDGENTFKIVVTSQKGTKKEYVIKITVKDESPITVTIKNNTYTVIKRESAIGEKDNFEKKTIKINDIEVPALYNSTSKLTLVGLKDKDGNIDLYIYEDGNYTLYKELKSTELTIIPLNTSKKLPYTKSTIKLNDNTYNCYKLTNTYSLIYGLDITTGEKDWYLYNTADETFQIYDSNLLDGLNDKISKSNKIIIALGASTLLFALLLIKEKVKSKNRLEDFKEKHKEEKKVKEKTILDDTVEITKVPKKKKKEEIKEVLEDTKENTDEIISKIDFDKTSTNIVTGKKELKKMKRVLDKDKKVQDKKKKEEIKEEKKYNNKANEKKLDEW